MAKHTYVAQVLGAVVLFGKPIWNILDALGAAQTVCGLSPNPQHCTAVLVSALASDWVIPLTVLAGVILILWGERKRAADLERKIDRLADSFYKWEPESRALLADMDDRVRGATGALSALPQGEVLSSTITRAHSATVEMSHLQRRIGEEEMARVQSLNQQQGDIMGLKMRIEALEKRDEK